MKNGVLTSALVGIEHDLQRGIPNRKLADTPYLSPARHESPSALCMLSVREIWFSIV